MTSLVTFAWEDKMQGVGGPGVNFWSSENWSGQSALKIKCPPLLEYNRTVLLHQNSDFNKLILS